MHCGKSSKIRIGQKSIKATLVRASDEKALNSYNPHKTKRRENKSLPFVV
jgi:hypothetical protein